MEGFVDKQSREDPTYKTARKVTNGSDKEEKVGDRANDNNLVLGRSSAPTSSSVTLPLAEELAIQRLSEEGSPGRVA